MPFNRKLYPPDWERISRYIIVERAGNCCEGSPAFPKCRARNGDPHPYTGSRVVLTCAHLDHDTQNNDPYNLRAWCQYCHLTHDLKHHAASAARTRKRRKEESGQLPLDLDNTAMRP